MTPNNTTVIISWDPHPAFNSPIIRVAFVLLLRKAFGRHATLLNGRRAAAHRGECKEAIFRLTDDVEGRRHAASLTTPNIVAAKNKKCRQP